MFTEEFLEKLPDEPVFALHKLCETFREYDNSVSGDGRTSDHYSDYLKAFATFQTFSEKYGIEFNYPDLGRGREEHIATIRNSVYQFYSEIDQKMAVLTIQKTKTRVSAQIDKHFRYEFSEEDSNKIQTLINELRDNITGSELFEENHRQRLLRKLESLQSELHKKVSDLYQFLGFMGDAGVVLGKFGKDAKPVVDRMIEIARIAWHAQARAEGLPNDAPIPRIED